MGKKACGWQTGTCCRSARAHELGARIVRAAAAAAAHQTRQVRHAASMLQQRKAPSLPLSAMAAHRLLPSLAGPALTSTPHVHLQPPSFTDSTLCRHPRKLPCLPLQPFGLKSTSQGWDFIKEEVTLRRPFSHYFIPRASVHCIYKSLTSLTLFASQIYEIVKGFYQEEEFTLEGFHVAIVESFRTPPPLSAMVAIVSFPSSLTLPHIYVLCTFFTSFSA